MDNTKILQEMTKGYVQSFEQLMSKIATDPKTPKDQLNDGNEVLSILKNNKGPQDMQRRLLELQNKREKKTNNGL